MEYKEMIIDEVRQVAKLHNELAYFTQKETKDDYWDFGELAEEPVSNRLQGFIDHPERRIFVAKDGEDIVGFIAGEVIQCHLPISSIKKVGFISAVFVMPEYRGKGIMKKLDSLIVDFFKGCGVKYVELFFISKNTVGRKCWNSLGYEVFREQARKRI